MTALVDTDVLVDVLRGTPAAHAWLSTVSNDTFAIPSIVAMELIVGCRNQNELQRVQRFLKTFTILWTDAQDSVRAYELLAAHRLTSGLSIPDCIVAAMALTRSATFYTFNVRHFGMIDGLKVHAPYLRA